MAAHNFFMIFSVFSKFFQKSGAVLWVILAVTLVTFAPVLQSGFTDWDDDTLLTQNPDVRALSWENVRTIFTSTYVKTYIPLTVLSFAVEYFFAGYDPFVYHLNNLLLHLGVVALVYILGKRLGLRRYAAAVGALLFAIHPMHVESVAWITERKDVLYSVFYLLAAVLYIDYVKTRSSRLYVLAVFSGFLSVLAKSMALSLPLVLWLCDWFMDRKRGRACWMDKLPFFLSLVPVALITYLVHARLPELEAGRAVLIWIWSFIFYIKKFFVPIGLEPLYALPEPVRLSNPVYGVSVLLFAAVLGALFAWRRHKWFIFAWGYYGLSIFFLLRYDVGPDLGVVADRFMYLPSVGFCLAIGAAAAKGQRSLGARRLLRQGISAGLLVVFVFLAMATRQQIRVWQNSATLWARLAKAFPDKAVAYDHQGLALYQQGQYAQAVEAYTRSLEARPSRAKGYVNRGNVYAKQGDPARALADYQKALRLDPRLKEAYLNRGLVHQAAGRVPEALADLTRAIRLDGQYLKAYVSRAELYARSQQKEKALADLNRVLALHPRHVMALMNRGNLYGMRGQYKRALKDLNLALKLSADNGILYNDRAVVYGMLGRYERALDDYRKAVALNPDYAPTYFARSLMYKAMGEDQKALDDARQAKALGFTLPPGYLKELQESI
jgi:tetratricopeptide (TPR) repeat protein